MNENYDYELTNYLHWNYSIFHAFAITTFAYASHTNIFPIMKELARPSERRIKKVFNRTVIAEICMFLCTSLCGYLSLQEQTPDLITLRPPLSVDDSDILMNIARAIITINYCVFAIPIRLNPLRAQIFAIIKKDPETSHKVYHYGITGLVLLGAAIMAILFSDINAFFSIFGGTLSVLVTIYYPGIIDIASI